VVNNLEVEDGLGAAIIKIQHLLNLMFDAVIIITMFLCFFCLLANMSANIFEQTKEIGVLRAMGVRTFRIKMLYFYEALVLVLASSFLGVVIGMTVGYLFTLQ
jgi:ABC-type antimicrobial peptide transport system permease subunit